MIKKQINTNFNKNNKIHNKKLRISSITAAIIVLIGAIGGYQYYKNHSAQTNAKSNEATEQTQNVSDKDRVIMFKDSNFDGFIRGKINKPQGAIHKSDIDYLTHLEIESHENIEDISGIEDMTNLQDLTISFNKIKNIDKLGRLSNLKTLNIQGGEITNINWVKELKNLNSLSLDSNKIKDISILKSLSKLVYISLRSNNITDISVLKGLTNLQEVYLDDNQVGNVDVLKGGVPHLEKFSIRRNKIADINPLMTAFKDSTLKYVDIDFNVGIGDANFQKLKNALSTCDIYYEHRDSEYIQTN